VGKRNGGGEVEGVKKGTKEGGRWLGRQEKKKGSGGGKVGG
jgi:hypothetical protein